MAIRSRQKGYSCSGEEYLTQWCCGPLFICRAEPDLAQAVAEMTGRKGRVVRDGRGHGVYELRAKPDSAEMDSLNVREAGAPAGLLAPSWSMGTPAAAKNSHW